MKKTLIVTVAALSLAACSNIKGTDAHAIKLAEKGMAYDLIDPSSAQFRDMKVYKAPAKTDAEDVALIGKVVCGQINGKNRNGAYTGFSRFVYSVGLEVGTISPDHSVTFDEAKAGYEDCKRGVANARGYASHSLALRRCDEAKEALEEFQEQGDFNSLWDEQCVAPTRTPVDEANKAVAEANEAAAAAVAMAEE